MVSRNDELAELLQELKERSGRSYSALAHRTGLSRSSVHRYCQGLTVPASFGTVERIARVCGVEQEELDRLYAAWVRAERATTEPLTPAGGEPEQSASDPAPRADEPAPRVDDPAPSADAPPHPANEPPHPADAPAPPPTSRWPRTLLGTAMAVAVALVAYVTFGPPAEPPPPRGGATVDQELNGPDWKLRPQFLDGEYFGVTMNTDTGEMPGFRVGGIRLWDSETRWDQIEPERGTYDWSVLESMVRAAERKGLPVLLTFGGTPSWAAPDGRRSAYPGSSSAPPDDLADWDRFVEKVATRYRGRIAAYELWDNVGTSTHYSGDMRTLAEMVRRAARIIRRVDEDARVACPSFGRLWEREGRELLRKFARTRAYDHCDVAALKLHPRRADGPPEEIPELVTKVYESVLYPEAVTNALWNTGPGKDIVTVPDLDAHRADAYAVRFYLVGLFHRKAPRMDRMYFYSWGSTTVPLVVEAVGGEPTEAGRRIGRLQDWLDGAGFTACGRGGRVDLPEGVYECRFVRRASGSGTWTAIRWTKRGTASAELEPGARLLHRMNGGSEQVRAGQRVEYGESPVLVEYGGGRGGTS